MRCRDELRHGERDGKDVACGGWVGRFLQRLALADRQDDLRYLYYGPMQRRLVTSLLSTPL